MSANEQRTEGGVGALAEEIVATVLAYQGQGDPHPAVEDLIEKWVDTSSPRLSE